MCAKQNLLFQKGKFIVSAAKENHFPKLINSLGQEPFEIALVGRSNVGKSSLINHLLKTTTLAKVSSTPGKTQCINFFLIDEMFGFADLPGYGFAKVSKEIRQKWGILIEHYLRFRKNLTLILLLLDIRHPPTEEDISFGKWAIHFQKPLLPVFTKADKLKPSKQIFAAQENMKIFCKEVNLASSPYVLYSIKEARFRNILSKKIGEVIFKE